MQLPGLVCELLSVSYLRLVSVGHESSKARVWRILAQILRPVPKLLNANLLKPASLKRDSF